MFLLKTKQYQNSYKPVKSRLGSDLTIEFRVFNDGLAYRFVTNRKGEVEVNETADFEFADNFTMWASPIDAYVGSYEVNYEKVKIAAFSQKNTYLPVLFENTGKHKMLLTKLIFLITRIRS
ncbi:MAG: glycoside hydrolase family 97 N-terminal domain-containing protein [Flavobacteriaceae bacterium]|nr:glycoside hydrolase family 97 N-terminal domain-containing protein [Flavobacteriaceae bacterium]